MTAVVIAMDLWDEDIEGVITAWLFDEGDNVSKEDILAEVMVEKIQHEIVSPADGTLKILVTAEDPVSRGDMIGDIS